MTDLHRLLRPGRSGNSPPRLGPNAGSRGDDQARQRAFGAEVELWDGSRDEVAAEAVHRADTHPYASHNWLPMFLQGVKTVGYEIWEQLGFAALDNIVMVAGSGSNVLGCELAFSELHAAGAIERLPRLFFGQPSEWAPIVDALHGAAPSGERRREPTIAEGAANAEPVRLPEVVDAVERTGGNAVRVRDEEICSAVRHAAQVGLLVEPTSAVALAALEKLIGLGSIAASEVTVVILTGAGLKSQERLSEIF